MKALKSLSALLLILTILTGCVKDEVNVKFMLPESVNDAYRMVYYASDPTTGFYVEKVAVVQKGKAEINFSTGNPTVIFIMRGEGAPIAAFYAERGDKIKITGEDSNPLSWRISGNEISDKWSDWRIANQKILSSGDEEKINKTVSDFVDKNREAPLSTILLSFYYDRNLSDKEFQATWKKLKGEAVKQKWIELVSRNDMVSGKPFFTDKVSRIVLHSIGTGADTLETAKTPAILYFWRRDDKNKEDAMKMLRKLAKEHPDSAKRFIADICFDSDSVLWHNSLRRDSLERTIRAWNPLGELDSVFSRLGVSGTPLFIVFDKKGLPVYKGEDIDKAEESFRNRVKSDTVR